MKNPHYSTDKEKHQKAVEKSRETIYKKYGSEGLKIKQKLETLEWYKEEKIRITNTPIVTKTEVSEFLKGKRDVYRGKSGNRKLKRDNIQIYSSLIKHCEEYQKYNIGKDLPFLAKIDIAINDWVISNDMLCQCGSRLNFNPITQDWTKYYCTKCRVSGTSMKHYQLKYGDDWEKYWYECRQTGNHGFITRGKNEKSILDEISKTYGIVIDRHFKILNYYPDGYCKENNTIYEIYEKHHRTPLNRVKDTVRQQIIQNELKCDYIIVWDDTLKLEIFNYVQS
jgi:hypothetical protein